MKLADILAANLDYLKINNIEKSMGLTKTGLVRMIARKEIPEKHKKVVEDWWNNFIQSLIPEKDYSNKIEDFKFAKSADIKKLDRSVRIEGNIEYAKTTPESYDAPPMNNYTRDEYGQMPIYEPIKDYNYYEKKGKTVGFDEAEDLIREILNSPTIKSWQKPMLQKMINSRFF